MRSFHLAILAGSLFFDSTNGDPSVHSPRATCTVQPSLNGTDDAPAILSAFKTCGKDGTVWSTNITYWLNQSMAFGYQNQTSAWWLGGNNINVNGYGYGTLDGNGQAWYDFVKGISNYPNRPQALTIWNTTNSVFRGLRFVQSQMCIALKANSTNILITNSTFYNGLGVAIGSIGQYKGVYESIENVTASEIVFYKTLHGGYVKTWTGEQAGYPPNGGGGGLGFQISDLSMYNISGSITNPITSYQCSAVAPCKDITMENIDVVDANGTAGTGYKCTNVIGTTGFTCTGPT
ncbi:hypothetical protein SS1G_02553 [Sclerotinia sclerotiorum 1980 UF-70]|uniref:Uncharacterized protein n=1 Tax=Sclerotinia sclerotiorum (strain ATCC 18683 / 1980 / Ss-1) TaxID=665079 RepID=A7EB67_SCLS1|nr:hypothetical protein SS1G_02553 [Sclerotinia sclerotiorum 1980 UF-70]EDN99695.1 hypothetical protein SS1G_02553 [Sclerotinia sclerotiorum 1980 UF-70]